MVESPLEGKSLGEGNFEAYIFGFLISIFLTLASYFIVAEELLTSRFIDMMIIGLAVLQMIAQVIFFLHLGNESAPRWNLQLFLFMLLIVSIVVFGSIWIMEHLNYNTMERPMEEMHHR